MASVVLNVSSSAKFNREYVNPETAEAKRWFEINVTTAETFKGFKRDANGVKVEADVNTIQKPASVFIAAFEAMDILGTLYAAAKPANPDNMDLYAKLKAAEATTLLRDAKVIVDLVRHEAGDVVDGEPVEEAYLEKNLLGVLPNPAFVAGVFKLVRESESVAFMFNMNYDASKTNAELAEAWLAEQAKKLA